LLAIEPNMNLSVFLALASLLSVSSDDADPQKLDQCKEEERAGTLLQTDFAKSEHPLQKDMTNSEIGNFQHLSSHKQGEPCHVSGTWSDSEGDIKFLANTSSIYLGIDGLPHLTMTYRTNGSLALIRVGDVIAQTNYGQDFPKTIKDGLQRFANSSVAKSRGKQFSLHLGAKGFHGGAAPCAYRLHMLLLTLAKSTFQKSKTYPYGTYKECPSYKTKTWKCETKTHWLFGKDITCRDISGQDAECHGLCGAKCDCWESLCGPRYGCGYNKVCCEHDYACDKWGYVSWQCLRTSTVLAACVIR